MAQATFLLPAVAAFGKQRLADDIARVLGRADRLPPAAAGRREQLRRHFDLPGEAWPIAALSRQQLMGDAADALWLRADPVHVRPDINGVRLLAYGDALALTDADSAALLPALMPVFGDAGFMLDAPTPSRWYLRLARGTPIPVFADPEDALGEDLFEHLPGGPEGRHWRSLLSQAQVVLHQHPWNAQREARGMPAINSLWFWGGGVMPTRAAGSRDRYAHVFSDDEILHALVRDRRIAASLPDGYASANDTVLLDLAGERDLAKLQRDWLRPALKSIGARVLELDFADGTVLQLSRGQRLRFWRKPIRQAQA
ncbi:MAG: phosphoglycerate mutase [Luteimonas sp.]